MVIYSHFMFYQTSYRAYNTFISVPASIVYIVPPFPTRTMKEQECV